jgi:tetratricopeptide (TPR) repeat protein
MACGRVDPVSAQSYGAPPPRRWAGRTGLIPLALLVVAAVLAGLRVSAADPIKAVVTASVSDGYARLVFDMRDYDDASVRQAGNVLIISFKTPIDVSVDRLAMQAPDFIGAARRDPDGKAVRLALARKVTVNAMPAGEKFFVDLLPETWSGLPPGLPQDVVEALARRARDAEKLADHERLVARTQQGAPVRVRVATQPTFTRYVFGIPEQVTVNSDRGKDRLTLAFDAPLKFDLGDAVAGLPRAIGAISSELEDGSASVRFNFRAKVEVRTFRDENGYVVDIVGADAQPDANGEAEHPQQSANAPAAAPATVPLTAPVDGGAGPAPTSPAAAVPAVPVGPATQTVADAIAELAAQAPAQPAPQPSTAAQPSPQPVAPASPAPPPPAAPDKTPGAAAKVEPPPAAPKPPALPPTRAVTEAPPAKPHEAGGKVPVELTREGANLKLSFDFMSPAAAAVFDRADTLWIVFDSKEDIDLSALQGEASRTIRSADLTRAPDADIVRIKLDRPRLSSVTIDGPVWTVEIGDSVLEPSRALDLTRNLIGPSRSSITVAFDAPHQLHRISDPEAGDQLLVVTAFAPARGLVHAQDFIEFRALASEQGVVVEPLADDLNVGLAPDKVVISRPNGLTLSSSLQLLLRGDGLRPQTFDSQIWGFDRQGSYVERQSHLIAAAAAAPASKRLAPRLDLARFYLARQLYPEAKGVLDVVLAEQRAATENVSAVVMRAVAEIMMDRPDDALKDLANPAVGDQHDAPLWRALAYARQGKWGQARAGFKTIEAAVATLPIELQRVALKDEMRASIEVGDFAEAENELNDLETIGVPHDMQPSMSVLIGRLDEGMGRSEDALAAYRTAADSWDRPAAAQGRLRETELRYSLGDLKRDDVVSDLESLTTVWRGDETEIEALQTLARLYTEEGRYRDSFYVMRSAMAAHPDWDMTRKIQEEAAKTFDSLFLAGEGDTLPAIDALALFYDFRELTPIGSRGDEMIRRLADRLVSVDLLDQAAGLLQYQVDKRLQGAARAQVATRLAVIYLMNRKPDRALSTLQETRTGDLSTELRSQRLLLEARAMSDLGRYDLALEVVADIPGRESLRLRSDIDWAARRWGKAAEQIELMYGDRWKQWQPLTDVERSDVLRAEIGYALAEDTLGLDRFREKYAPKMAGTPDARAFEIVSAPLGTSGEDFKDIAHAAAAEDTLDDFLSDMKARYPDSNAVSPGETANPAPPPPPPSAAAPSSDAIAPVVTSPPPETRSSVPVGPPLAPSAAAGRTALR